MPLPSFAKIAFVVASGASLCACAHAPEPVTPDNEIPSREEVFEVDRLARPAGPGAIAAVTAYRQKVCEPREDGARMEPPHSGRRCFGAGPVDELRMLEELRRTSASTPDEPKILERMISNWHEVASLALRECVTLEIPGKPTVGDVERAQQTLHSLDDLRHKAMTEPPKLCAQLRAFYPAEPTDDLCAPPGRPPESEPASSDWF